MNIFDEDEVAIHVLTEQLDEARVALVASRAEVRKLRSAVVPLRSIARMTLKEGPSAPLTNSIRSVLAVTSWVDGTEHIDARGFDDGMDSQDRQELNHNLGVMAVTGLICAIYAWYGWRWRMEMIGLCHDSMVTSQAARTLRAARLRTMADMIELNAVDSSEIARLLRHPDISE